jgi:hypothetical protein
MLDEGVYTSVSEIGGAEKISKSYVSRILRLALLAPASSRRPLGQEESRAAAPEATGAAAAGELGGAARAFLLMNRRRLAKNATTLCSPNAGRRISTAQPAV